MNINYVNNEEINVNVTCADCGTTISIDAATCIDGDYYCRDCLCECDLCGCVIPRNDAYSTEDSGYDYCRDCFEHEMYVCCECGGHYRYEDEDREIDGRYYCDRCYEDFGPMIRDYHEFKNNGNIIFHGDENRRDALYMGFELEIDSDHHVDRERIARGLQERFGDFMHYENDGSLNFGFECITQPASLNYHLSLMPKYKEAFKYLIENEMMGHDAKTAGFHIHIDRKFFGTKEDSSIAKMLFVFEKFRPELMKFSRRTEAQCADWCRSRKGTYNTESGWIKKAVMESKGFMSYGSRYYSVNLTNSNTLEIRLWRSSLNIETFEATLRFTERIANICKHVRAIDLAKMTFNDLLGNDEVVLNYWHRINNK